MSWLSTPAIRDRLGPRLCGFWRSEKGRDGRLLHLLDSDAMAGGGGPAVFKLRRCVQHLAGERADLDANVAIGRGNGNMRAVEAGPSILADAHAQGGGLAE